MAVGTYKLPICDGCKLPWLPVGWTQDSDPRQLAEGAKPLRCGKCKTIGWDREFVKQQKTVAVEVVGPFVYTPPDVGVPDVELSDDELRTRYATPVTVKLRAKRCRHRLTDCSICHPKEAA